MGWIRVWVRMPLLLLWTLVMWGFRLILWPAASLSERVDRRWRTFWMKVWGWGAFPIMGIRVTVKGTPPEPPCYIVANHLSYLDVVILGGQCGYGFVARGDMENWPLIGFMSKSLYVLFVDRKKKKDAARVNQDIAHALEVGDGIVVFAESRISPGRDVAPFKSALIQPALECGHPVHCVTLSYACRKEPPVASEVVGWWRPEPLFYHMRRLLAQPGVNATIHYGDAPVTGENRKIVADAARAVVREKFVPLR